MSVCFVIWLAILDLSRECLPRFSFLLWPLVPRFHVVFCSTPMMRDIYFFPLDFWVNLESIALLFNICGREEVQTEQLIDLWECLGKQLSMKWGSYYRLENQFYSVVQIPTENKSMEKEIKYILILASSLFGHSILKSRKCPITFHAVWQMVWRC